MWPKMARLGPRFRPQKSPRKSLCGSLFGVLSQEMRHINIFLGRGPKWGVLGGGQQVYVEKDALPSFAFTSLRIGPPRTVSNIFQGSHRHLRWSYGPKCQKCAQNHKRFSKMISLNARRPPDYYSSKLCPPKTFAI